MSDRWIIGEPADANGNWYLIHLGEPAFVCRIIDPEDWDESGMAYVGRDYAMVEFRFFGDEPIDEAFTQLCAEGYAELARYDDEAEDEVEDRDETTIASARRREHRRLRQPPEN